MNIKNIRGLKQCLPRTAAKNAFKILKYNKHDLQEYTIRSNLIENMKNHLKFYYLTTK